jgi:hypothetical protein
VTQAVSVDAQASLSSFVFVFTRGTPGVPTTLTVDIDDTDAAFARSDGGGGGGSSPKSGSASSPRPPVARDVAFIELGLEEERRRGRVQLTRFGGATRYAAAAGAAAAAGGAAAPGAGDTEKERADADKEEDVRTVRFSAFEQVAARLDGARKMLYAQKELKQLQASGASWV